MLALLVLLLVLLIPFGAIVYYLRRLLLIDRAMKSSEQRVVCPKCHRLAPLQYFICPSCNQVKMIVPTENSIFYYRCDCGKTLPTTNYNGRSNLTAICRFCGHVLGKNAGCFEEIIIPIVGGPSSGKSAFLSAWIVALQKNIPAKYPVRVSYPFQTDEDFAKRSLTSWSCGIKPDKTAIIAPNGVVMDIIQQKKNKGVRIFCYDPAGEFFDNVKSLMGFRYYDYMDGVIFLVDPFSILSVQRRYACAINKMADVGFQVSDRDMNDYCDRFINSLKMYHNLKDNQYHYANCAVVITKADAFDLDSVIGDKAIKKIQAQFPSLGYEDAMDAACTGFLQRNGMGDVLAKLQNHFSEVKCFSVSAFGHMPDMKTSFIPKRVELPFFWILRISLSQTKVKFLSLKKFLAE